MELAFRHFLIWFIFFRRWDFEKRACLRWLILVDWLRTDSTQLPATSTEVLFVAPRALAEGTKNPKEWQTSVLAMGNAPRRVLGVSHTDLIPSIQERMRIVLTSSPSRTSSSRIRTRTHHLLSVGWLVFLVFATERTTTSSILEAE